MNRPKLPQAPATKKPVAAVRPTLIFRVLAGVSHRRVRGLSLLVSLSGVLAVSALVAFSVLPWWSVVIAVAVLLADFLWLRRVAVSDRVAVRPPAQPPLSAAGPARPEVGRSRDSRSDPRSAPEPVVESVYEPPKEPELRPLVEAAVTGQAALFDRIDAPAVADLPGWAPIPVPPPTYTLKAKATQPPKAPPTVHGPAVNGPWSLDGMEYDCDLDELVERRSANGA